MTILDKIIEHKKLEVAAAKRAVPDAQVKDKAARLAGMTRGFRVALTSSPRPVAVIAELKKMSPSKGVLRDPFDPVVVAKSYQNGGASALSVLTDEKFFAGRLEYLARVRETVALPLLRKDFIVDPYQVAETLAAGADALLLIAAVLETEELLRLHASASSLGLDVLIEVHSEDDLKKLTGIRDPLVGINNRDLRTFEVDLKTTERLMAMLPAGTCAVSESGVKEHADLLRLGKMGVRAVLVGESLITQKDPGAALKELLK